jgi:hypothetical protein
LPSESKSLSLNPVLPKKKKRKEKIQLKLLYSPCICYNNNNINRKKKIKILCFTEELNFIGLILTYWSESHDVKKFKDINLVVKKFSGKKVSSKLRLTNE